MPIVAGCSSKNSSDTAGSATKPRRFLFLMPDGEPVRHETRPRRVREARAPGASNPRTMREARAHGAGHLEPKVEPQDDPNREHPPTPQTQLALVQPPAPAGPAAPAAIEEAFGTFWQTYPRREGKGTARTAFAKAVAKVGIARVLDGAARYAADPNLPERQLVPHPTTWLNGERWDDEPLPPRAGVRGQGQTRGQAAIDAYLGQRIAAPGRGVLHPPQPPTPKGLTR